MKIYINRQPKSGPWGGGAKTVNKLVEKLLSAGHTVVYQLSDDIDVIFCFDPRPNNFGEYIEHMYAYRTAFPKTKIIQRIGDVGTHGKPELTQLVKYCAKRSDYFIFPSEWAKEKINFEGDNYSVIPNAPMLNFYENRNNKTVISSPVKVVTHHWSTNPRKGFDLYKKFDSFCQSNPEFEFTYIGQLPPSCKISNYVSPMSVSELVQELPKHDIYLTASEEEAGANHVLEAMACGLPVVYRDNGGSIPEYCSSGCKSYSDYESMIESLRVVSGEYSNFKSDLLEYKSTNDFVVEEYCKIIGKIR